MDNIFRSGLPVAPDARLRELQARFEKLTKINASLMHRVERSMEQQANSFSMFQTAIGLESQVRIRTDQLNTALDRLERANEELVTARDTAERANRFKTRFFTAVGHDLLQPLHAARLSLSAMSDTGDTANDKHLLDQIDHALLSIEELLRTILDLSKLEAGFTAPIIQTVPLVELFPAIIRDLLPIAQAKHLALHARDTKLQVLSDPMMLRRVVQNLVANAVHYTQHGQVRVMARRRGGNVRIEVWDTGPGIPAAEQSRIFEEFQRGSASGSARVGGFGLGLSIVQRMTDALGHPITVCSREGRGTCFKLLVPFAGNSTAARRSHSDAGQVYGLPSTRVLVIDNEPTVLAAMETLLSKWSCEVRCASSGEDVERLLASEPDFMPDIVLADYHLNRGETGIALIGALRKFYGETLPCIVITADHALQLAGEPSEGGIEVLKKPVKPAELRSLMLHLLRPR